MPEGGRGIELIGEIKDNKETYICDDHSDVNYGVRF